MSKRTKHRGEEPEVEAPRDADSPSEPQAHVPAPEEDELTVLRREVDELREKNLRLLAEAQNQQKRAQREKQDALRFAESEFARELLVILDDLERTQESARSATDARPVVDGVRIVYEHFLKVLKTRGIEPIEALGQPFDPTYHEAMLQQPSAEQPAGTVLQEMTRGYKMHERVLRSSRVIVSSGSPDAGRGGEQEQEK